MECTRECPTHFPPHIIIFSTSVHYCRGRVGWVRVAIYSGMLDYLPIRRFLCGIYT